MKKNKRGEKARYNLGRQIKSPQKKESFHDYKTPVRNSHACTVYRTVERNGSSQLTLYGFYVMHLREFQNERKLAPSTCKVYDQIVCELIAPACAEYALAEMDEIDFLMCWQQIQDSSDSARKTSVAYSLFRMIAEFAYRYGGTSVTLWGLPPNESHLKKDCNGPQVCDVMEEEVYRYVKRGVHISNSIPLQTEMKLFLRLAQQVPLHGEALGGLILFSTGTRTSETVAFQYRHLTEVSPGCWALQRINVSNPNARDSEIGGKTHNAFRLLWIPLFLAKLILDQRQKLLQIYPEATVQKLHIACRGMDYQTPCTQKELNTYMKDMFEIVGVTEDLVASAFRAIGEDENAKWEYERSVVAYLGRHQAITAMVYCGLTEAQICACAGHEQVNTDMREYDFVNPDTFRKLAAALSRRPVFQVLDQITEARQIIYDGNAQSVSSDSGLQISFDTDYDTEFLLIAHSVGEYGTVELESMDKIRILKKWSFDFPTHQHSDPLSIRSHLYTNGKAAYTAVKHSSINAKLTSTCAVNDSKWLQRSADMDICVCQGIPEETPPLSDVTRLLADLKWANLTGDSVENRTVSAAPVLALPSGPAPALALPAGPVPALMLPSAPASADVTPTPSYSPAAEHLRPSNMSTPDFVLTAVAGTALTGSPNAPQVTISAQTILLDQSQRLTVLPSGQYPLFRRNVQGERFVKEKELTALYAYQPDMQVYLLSRQGRFYSGAAGCLTATANVCQDVLRNRGILLQNPVFAQSGSFLVCLTTIGKIICVETKCLSRRIPTDGVELANSSTLQAWQSECVSACICPAGSDVLLITECGQVLRIANSDLHARKSLPLVPIHGIDLEPGDRAIACVPVTDDGVFTVTANGYGFLCREKIHMISPHGRNTQGVAFMNLKEHDRIVSAFVPGSVIGTLREDGMFKLLDVEDFPDHGRTSGGVIAAKTKEHKRIVAAVTYRE